MGYVTLPDGRRSCRDGRTPQGGVSVSRRVMTRYPTPNLNGAYSDHLHVYLPLEPCYEALSRARLAGRNRRDSLPSIFGVSRRRRYPSPGLAEPPTPPTIEPRLHPASPHAETLPEIPLRISHALRSVASEHVLCFLSRGKGLRIRRPIFSALSRRSGISPGGHHLHATGLAGGLFRVSRRPRHRAGRKDSRARNPNSRHPR